jgi:biopolymer transport protein ExbD
MNPMAAPLAALLFGLAAFMASCSHPSTGLAVRIAGVGRCGDVRNVVLEVLPGGVLRLNSENQKRGELGHSLQDIFRTRAYRYVFVIGDPNVSFGEVAEVIDIASTQVDFVSIPPPSVLRKATYQETVPASTRISRPNTSPTRLDSSRRLE